MPLFVWPSRPRSWRFRVRAQPRGFHSHLSSVAASGGIPIRLGMSYAETSRSAFVHQRERITFPRIRIPSSISASERDEKLSTTPLRVGCPR